VWVTVALVLTRLSKKPSRPLAMPDIFAALAPVNRMRLALEANATLFWAPTPAKSVPLRKANEPPISTELAFVVPSKMVPLAAACKLIAPAPLPPWMVVVWAAAAIDPMVTPTVPVVEPPAPIATVLVVPAPGVPLAMLTATPPEVAALPLPILTVWVAADRLPEPIVTRLVPVDCPRVMVPVLAPEVPIIIKPLVDVVSRRATPPFI
jgi:hypothetical protein